jgi:hypothetical protein
MGDTVYGNLNTGPSQVHVPRFPSWICCSLGLFSLSFNHSTTNYLPTSPSRSLALVVAVHSFSIPLDTAGGRFDLTSLIPFCLVRKIQ